jgi:iron complex transport system substrate-binding protein
VRIICLSAEAADICARLGAWEEVVAVSAFASQDGLAPKPVISGFSTCDCERVASHAPDLVITFSDVQAGIAAELIRAGCAVLATNQRTLAEVAQTIRIIGGAIGRAAEAERLAAAFQDGLAALAASPPDHRPRVYFEEWPEPMISGIAWVSEIIELAGGADVFAGNRAKAARDRTVTVQQVAAADPEIVLARWCGKPVNIASICGRAGFENVSAVRASRVFSMDSSIVLQPGPRLLAGAEAIRRIIESTCSTVEA